MSPGVCKRLEASVKNLAVEKREAPRMLIADDDPLIVRLVAERCASMGFEVETATNGLQALIKARRSNPEVMIIDVNMPGADGLSVCARLLAGREHSPDVIVVTGSGDPETLKRCQSMGAFYGRKGPEFWTNINSALVSMFPRMADRINEVQGHSTSAEVRKRPRVLVIDDDPDIAAFFTGRLAKYGVDTSHASNGAQGYRMACKDEPSIITCDYLMPDGDPHYLLWRLRSTLITANIPVFMLTGRTLDESTRQMLMREVCGHPGVVRFFTKSPDVFEPLFEALQQFCAFETHREDS